jgi:hypothetical protein
MSYYIEAEREGVTREIATIEAMPDEDIGMIQTERGAVREARKLARNTKRKVLVAKWNDFSDRYTAVGWVWPDGDFCTV